MLLAMAACDLRDLLPHVAVPTLLLYGDVDRKSPLSIAEALHAAIPSSQLVVLAGVGHASNIEAAAAFNERSAGSSPLGRAGAASVRKTQPAE